MAVTERLVIDLPKELVDKLREHVASGAFKSESHAVESVLKTSYFGEDDLSPDEVEEVRAAIAEAEADVAAGRVYSADEVYARLRAVIKEVADRQR